MKARTKKALVLVREIALGLAPAAAIIGVALLYAWAIGEGYWPRDAWYEPCTAEVKALTPCEVEDGVLKVVTRNGNEYTYRLGSR